MQGWAKIDTARCERCAIYTPTTDLVFSTDGKTYCTSCGVPPVDIVWEDAATFGTRIARPAKVAALVMLAVTLAFPLAACVSQL